MARVKMLEDGYSLVLMKRKRKKTWSQVRSRLRLLITTPDGKVTRPLTPMVGDVIDDLDYEALFESISDAGDFEQAAEGLLIFPPHCRPVINEVCRIFGKKMLKKDCFLVLREFRFDDIRPTLSSLRLALEQPGARVPFVGEYCELITDEEYRELFISIDSIVAFYNRQSQYRTKFEREKMR